MKLKTSNVPPPSGSKENDRSRANGPEVLVNANRLGRSNPVTRTPATWRPRNRRVPLLPRTCYSITDQGRRLLAQWLATPSSRFLLHFEPLLRVHLASHGTKEDLLRSLQEARDVAADIRRVGTDVASDFIAGRHVLQHDAHVRALVFDFLWSLSETIDTWADRSEQEVRQWPDLSLTDANRAHAIDTMRQALARSK